MSTQIPIQYTELFNLQNLGVNPQSISFTTVTLESDKFVCVRDQVSPNKTIQIIEVDNQNVTTNKVNADSAIMHPTTKVLALRGRLIMKELKLIYRISWKRPSNFQLGDEG